MRMKRARLSEERRASLKRLAVYVAWFFILAIAETSFFANVTILPSAPNLILPVILVIALTDTRENTVIAAIAGGLIGDAISATGIYLSPIFYMAAALLLCLFAKKMMPRFLSWLALMPVTLAFVAIFSLLIALLYYRPFNIGDLLLSAVLPKVIGTLLFSLPLFPLVSISVSPFIDRRARALR